MYFFGSLNKTRYLSFTLQRVIYSSSFSSSLFCLFFLLRLRSYHIIKDGKEKLLWVLCFLPKHGSLLPSCRTQKNDDFLTHLFVIICIATVSLLCRVVEWAVMGDKHWDIIFLYFLLALLCFHSSIKHWSKSHIQAQACSRSSTQTVARRQPQSFQHRTWMDLKGFLGTSATNA